PTNPTPTTTTRFAVTGFHTYAETRTTGIGYTITVTVTQNAPGSIFIDSDTSVHTTDSVVIVDAPLTAGVSAPIFTTENAPLNNVLVATFSDTNPAATAADFIATINWGDGSTPTQDPNARVQLISGTATTAVFGVFGSHVYTGLGSNLDANGAG